MAYSQLDMQGAPYNPAASVALNERLTFIRKVYLMTLSGFALFFLTGAGIAVGALAQVGPLVAITNVLLHIHFLIYFALFLGISYVGQRLAMVPGVNIAVYYGVAASMGVLSVPLIYIAAGTAGMIILAQALGLTVLTFGSLTAFVFITKKDFSFLGSFLFVGWIMAVIASLGLWVANSFFGVTNISSMSIALTYFTALVFVGYVLYNTSNILHRYSTDMVVPAALALLIDFIMLFRLILSLLLSRRR